MQEVEEIVSTIFETFTEEEQIALEQYAINKGKGVLFDFNDKEKLKNGLITVLKFQQLVENYKR